MGKREYKGRLLDVDVNFRSEVKVFGVFKPKDIISGEYYVIDFTIKNEEKDRTFPGGILHYEVEVPSVGLKKVYNPKFDLEVPAINPGKKEKITSEKVGMGGLGASLLHYRVISKDSEPVNLVISTTGEIGREMYITLLSSIKRK